MQSDFIALRDKAIEAFTSANQAFEQAETLENTKALKASLTELVDIFGNVSRTSQAFGEGEANPFAGFEGTFPEGLRSLQDMADLMDVLNDRIDTFIKNQKTQREEAKKLNSDFNKMNESIGEQINLQRQRQQAIAGGGGIEEIEKSIEEIYRAQNREKFIETNFNSELKKIKAEAKDISDAEKKTLKEQLGVLFDMTQKGDDALDIAKKRLAAEEKLANAQRDARDSVRGTLDALREQIALVGMDDTQAAQRTAIRKAEKQFAEAGLALTIRQRGELGLLIALLEYKKRLEEDKKAVENAEDLIERYRNEREQLDMTNNERELAKNL